MQPAKRVAVNTIILYGRMGITVFISLYVTRLILAALGNEDFGIFNLIGGAIAMLTFLNVAMASATQRFMSYSLGEGKLNKQKHIFNVSIILHFLISVILVLLLEFIGIFLFKGFLNIPDNRINSALLIYHFMLISTFFTINFVPYEAVINAHEHMLVVAVIGVIEVILKLFIALIVTYSRFDKLEMYGVLMAGLSLISYCIRSIYCHIRYAEVKINFRKYFNKSLFKEMTSFAGWTLICTAASIFTMQGITLVLNSFFGVIVNAAQGIANQISGQALALSTTMLKALKPVIVKSEGENNRQQMLKASMVGNKISFFLLTFISIPIILETPFILEIWLKEPPEYAVIFCRLILIRFIIQQLTVTFPTAIGAVGIIKQSSIIDTFIYLSVLPISYFVFKIIAVPAVIYVNLIIMDLALTVSRIYFTKRFAGLSLNIFLKEVVIPCFSSLFLALAFVLIPFLEMQQGLNRLLTVLLVHIFTYTTFICLVGLQKNERQLLFSLLRTGLIGLKIMKHVEIRKSNT